MDTDLTGLRWFKSSASSAAGCVEIAHLPEGGARFATRRTGAGRPTSSTGTNGSASSSVPRMGNSTFRSPEPSRRPCAR